MNIGFTSSLSLDKHPLLSANNSIKSDYYSALIYFTIRQNNDAFVRARIEDYRLLLGVDMDCNQRNLVRSVKRILTQFNPFRNRYKYLLLCDIALILIDEKLIVNAEKEMRTFVLKKQYNRLNLLIDILFGEKKNYPNFIQRNLLLIEQYQKNHCFVFLPEKRYVVTATMSAGKSTLINAIIGKPLARTSVEACTGNTNYFYNKPFEDGAVHLNGNMLTLHAEEQMLTSLLWDKESQFASFFRCCDNTNRICIVDTPGINSAIYKRHGSISKEVLQKDVFDKVIYVLNASKIGTDEELAYIRWISEHVPHDKVIFVLNKLDIFKISEDDVSESINSVRNDLLKFFENPIICPLSARFALLLKMKSYGDKLTPDEEDEYEYFAKKFKKPEYDLSQYYSCTYLNNNTEESVLLSQKCGIYGFLQMLQGENL